MAVQLANLVAGNIRNFDSAACARIIDVIEDEMGRLNKS